MSITQHIDKLRNNEIDIVELTYKIIEQCKKINQDYHYFNIISEERALHQAKLLQQKIKNKDKSLSNRKLLGVAVSAKDAICVKGVESTAGSRILQGYKPLFDATVIRKAEEQGAIVIGKTAQDEFGFGSFSVNVGLEMKIPLNPFDKERSCGGSSGGAGGITQKADFAHIALGESTGGSIAAPASFCGVFGLTPTYGRVSRYGLMDYGNSLDKIGTLGKTCHETALLFEAIAGYDEKDSTSLNEPSMDYTSFFNHSSNNDGGNNKNINKKNDSSNFKNMANNKSDSLKNKKIGIIKEAFSEGVEKDVDRVVWQGIKKMEHEGVICEEISLSLPVKYGLAAYYLIATSEASTNLAKYCGIRYGMHEKLEGTFNDYFSKVRSSHFGQEAKRRIMLGTFARMSGFRDAFYMKALKVRAKIIEEYKRAFKQYDALVSPSVPVLPPKFSEIEKLTPLQHYMMDIMLVSPNLAGLPHLSVPAGMAHGLPVGMLLMGDHLEERKLLQIGGVFDKE